MSYYGALLLITLVGPLFLSFDKKVAFYKNWKYLFPIIFLVAILFIVWDKFFVSRGVWSFNTSYISKIQLFGLPLEELLFFLIIPFACMFIYEVVKAYFGKLNLELFGRAFAFGVGLSGLLLTVEFLSRWYTYLACGLAFMLVLLFYFRQKVTWFPQFALAFCISFIPFLVIDGALTGLFTNEPAVWYNPEQISGFRILSIPVEDVFYNFDLLALTTWMYERLKAGLKK